MGRGPGGVDVFHTDRAVILGAVGEALVAFSALGQAEATRVAVGELLPASYPVT